MRLYLIKRQLDGKFYVNINGHYSIHTGKSEVQWSDKGRFLRTPDGVAANLRKLCSKPYWSTNPPPGVCAPVAARWGEVAWADFDANKLAAFEIVVMDLDIISMKATPATEFIQIDAIENAPLTKSERAA